MSLKTVFMGTSEFSVPTLEILIKSPPVYAIIISVFFLYFEIETPLFLENTTFLLTYATIFLVLMSLGIALTRFKFSMKDSIMLSLCRVILGPLIAFTLNCLLDLLEDLSSGSFIEKKTFLILLVTKK